jgi:hypothetical protein
MTSQVTNTMATFDRFESTSVSCMVTSLKCTHRGDNLMSAIKPNLNSDVQEHKTSRHIQITEPARSQCLTSRGTRKCGSPIEMDGADTDSEGIQIAGVSEVGFDTCSEVARETEYCSSATTHYGAG